MILTAAALIPTFVLMVYVYKLDKIEKEPIGLLIKTFLLGGIMSIPIIICEYILSDVIGLILPQGSPLFIIVEDFIAIAVIEEYFKRLAVKKVAYKNKEFNYLFDGIVYAVFSALGFAAFENVMYVLENGIFVALMRAVTSIPAHAIFGVIMGYYLGHAKMARLQGEMALERSYLKKSLLYPVLLHGFYDAAIELNHPVLMMIWFIFVVNMEIRAFRFLKKQAQHDRPLIETIE